MKHVLLIWLALYSLNIMAGDNEWMTQAWLGVTGLRFEYEEFDDAGKSLDREKGFLPGLVVGIGAEYGAYFTEAELQWQSGNVNYYSPAATSVSSENIVNFEIMTGSWLYDSDRLRAGIVAGMGYRTWHRDIYSTSAASGLDEKYRWGYWLLGVRGRQLLENNTVVEASLLFTRAINPSLDIHFVSRYDDTGLDLGEENGFKATIKITRQINNDLALAIQPWFEYWKLGRSASATLYADGVPSGTVFEPHSTTNNYGVNIELRW